MSDQQPTQAGVPAIKMTDIAVGAMRNPDRLVAEGINWTVNVGDYWVVAGLHASGKSDLLMLTGGLMAPREGRYRFFGEDMPIFEETRLTERLRLGLVFEGGRLFNHLTVAENLALPLRYHGRLAPAEVESRVVALLELTGLTPWANRAAAQLGRSWQQRAGLARALGLQPEVLLLDSPLTGLDARHTGWWLETLGQLARGHRFLAGRRLTLVATADDLRPWRRHANRVACLTGQRLRVLGDWPAAENCDDAIVRELLSG